MTRNPFIVALAVCLALAVAACGQSGVGKPVLKIGSQKGGTKSLILASGVLDGAPYRVEWSDFPAAQTLLEAISAGAVDLGEAGDAPYLFAFSSGAHIKAVHATHVLAGGKSVAILIPPGSPIQTEADLRGKRIAVGRGSIGHYLLLSVLDRAGIQPSQVTTVFLSPADAKAAFSSGSVDAWSTWGPYVPLAVRDNRARVLVDGRGLVSGYGFMAASDKAIADKRPQLEDFLTRLGRAQRWRLSHKAQYAEVLSKETGMDLDIAAATAANSSGLPVPIDDGVVGEEVKVLQRFKSAGLITSVMDVRQGFDRSFHAASAP